MIGNDHGKGNAGARYPKDDDFRQRVSETLKGKKKSATHAQHIGDRHRGLVYNLGNNWNVGRKQSETEKETHRQVMLGFRHSEEAKQKMRKPKSPETIANMRAAWVLRKAKKS